MIATLCVGLAVVFAGMTGIGVVNTAQHSLQVPHEHGPAAELAAVIDHHDSAHDDDHADREDGSADRHPAVGHHHADAPAGLIPNTVEGPAGVQQVRAVLNAANPSGAEGSHPGGLKRPPRTPDNLA